MFSSLGYLTALGVSYAGTASLDAAVSTTAMDVTGANLIIIVTSNAKANGVAALSDNVSNSFTALTASTGSTNIRLQVFYCYTPTTSAAYVATIAATTGNAASLCVLAVANATASPFDVENATATATTGSVTPSQNNELIVQGYSDIGSTSQTMTFGSATTIYSYVAQSSVVGGNRFAFMVVAGIQTVAAATTLAFGGGADNTTVTATFKLAAPAAGGSAGGSYGFA